MIVYAIKTVGGPIGYDVAPENVAAALSAVGASEITPEEFIDAVDSLASSGIMSAGSPLISYYQAAGGDSSAMLAISADVVKRRQAKSKRRVLASELLIENLGPSISSASATAILLWRDSGTVINSASQMMPPGNGIERTTGINSGTVKSQLNGLNVLGPGWTVTNGEISPDND